MNRLDGPRALLHALVDELLLDPRELLLVERIELAGRLALALPRDVDAEQRRLSDEHVAALDQPREVAEEERQQQPWICAPSTSASARDDQLPVAQVREVDVVLELVVVDPDRERDRLDLLVGVERVGAVLPGVLRLALQRQHRLKLLVARLLRRPARRIAFDDEELVAVGIVGGPVMWQKLRSGSVPIRRGDVVVRDIEHPLLASLSREVRELQINLSAVAADDVHHVDDRAGGGTHLERLQDALRTDRIAEPGGRADGSVQVHSCHGAARQVEVLRELVLRLFQDDPTLDPRDVIVMCPDVETHAPLIRAAFGQVSHSHPGHELRVRLADRALRQTNPLLDVMTDLLLLAGGRVKASEVLDLADTPPVRTRFGFGDDDLERLRQWTAESGARWGINDTQRKSFGLGGFRQNTFDAGLDRILLGVAADETELGWLDTALPLDDVDSADVELAGRFAEFISRLDTALTSLRGPRPATQWAENLATALDLLTAVRPADAWQRGQALRELASATEHGGDTTVRLADVRAMLSHRLAGRPDAGQLSDR